MQKHYITYYIDFTEEGQLVCSEQNNHASQFVMCCIYSKYLQ